MRFVPVPLLAPLLAAALLATVCGGPGSGESPPAEAARTYTVRGRVVTPPADDDGEIRLTHEAIDDFVSADGEVVGMDAMTMTFPLAGGIDAAALAVGDVVEFDLRVDWTSEPPAVVTRLDPLPAGTELVSREAEPTD